MKKKIPYDIFCRNYRRKIRKAPFERELSILSELEKVYWDINAKC